MFEDQTYEAILKRMLDEIPDEIDKREGSIPYDMLGPMAAELAIAYTELDKVLQFGFIDTTYGEFIDEKAKEAGIYRRPAVKAVGHVTFSGPTGQTIPAGTIVYTNNNIRFLTNVEATIVNGNVTIGITAERAGVAGNVPANSIVNTLLTGFNVTNTNPTSGGADIESDDSLRNRYLSHVRKPGVSGNANHYREWALLVPGIGDARVIPLWDGPGTVKVIVISSDKGPVPPELVQDVADEILKQKPIGATPTIESGVSKPINISAVLELYPDYTIDIVKPLVEQRLGAYFKEITFVEDELLYSKVGAMLIGTEGIKDYSQLLIDGEAANVAIGINEIPTVGTVTLS